MNKRATLILGIVAISLVWSGASAQANIVTNGDFEGGFYGTGVGNVPNGWTALWSVGVDELITKANDNGPTLPGYSSPIWEMHEGGAELIGCEQILNYDVTNCVSLTLTIDVKVFMHTMGGSGPLPDDGIYPVTVVVYYTDTQGNLRYWQWGWYIWIDAFTGPCPNHKVVWGGYGVVTGQQIAGSVWVPNSFNLLTELINPKTITKIQVGGSGVDLEGGVDNVQILCQGAIPTLTEWGLIIFGVVLLGFITWVFLKRRKVIGVKV